MVDIVKNVKENEWKSFLNNRDEATIYHTPEWKQFLEKTFGYKPEYFFAKDESGNMVGLLPLFYIKSKLTGNRLCSVPFSHICGPIGTKDISIELLEEAINLFKKSNLNSLEIREPIDDERFVNLNSFSTYVLELSSKPDDVWAKLNKGSVKRAIKKAEKSGVTVEKTRDLDDLKEFYEINATAKRELGVPCHPWNFFKNIFDILGNNASLYASKYNDEIIGGGIMTYFKNTVIYGYGASDSNYLNLYPSNAFLWKSIEDACVKGYNIYDFGRASYSNTGLIDFKKRWGTIETKLYYSNYPTKSNSLSENRESAKYKLASRIIRKIPLTMYKQFSDIVFQHFG
ncbi:MAG: peptidoglycan bridge formation glycyltransferase FemA/FemB family protein [Alphaproteobacteria bacterium]|nr:MAG: peptidoglycan bridge formation glycyltransferase FemA/FemB family protein [Euryarchaeota archaeon]RPJ76127.1 MAG: peptidoglycan bridge formation glycyltransferase FemA/FemB family protein [Alphaproteobacteria bacterium]